MWVTVSVQYFRALMNICVGGKKEKIYFIQVAFSDTDSWPGKRSFKEQAKEKKENPVGGVK